jgi:hypothetical protein
MRLHAMRTSGRRRLRAHNVPQAGQPGTGRVCSSTNRQSGASGRRREPGRTQEGVQRVARDRHHDLGLAQAVVHYETAQILHGDGVRRLWDACPPCGCAANNAGLARGGCRAKMSKARLDVGIAMPRCTSPPPGGEAVRKGAGQAHLARAATFNSQSVQQQHPISALPTAPLAPADLRAIPVDLRAWPAPGRKSWPARTSWPC